MLLFVLVVVSIVVLSNTIFVQWPASGGQVQRRHFREGWLKHYRLG